MTPPWPALTTDYWAHGDISLNELNQRIAMFAPLGWFIQSLAMHGAKNSPRYAVSFLKDNRSPRLEQVVDGPLGAGKVLETVGGRLTDRWAPTILTMTGDAEGVVYTLVSQRRPTSVSKAKTQYPVPNSVTVVQANTWLKVANAATAADRMQLSLISIDACIGPSEFQHFCALFEARTRRTAWNLHGLWQPDPGFFAGYDKQYKGLNRGFARAVAAVPIPWGRTRRRADVELFEWGSGVMLFSQGDSTVPFVVDPEQFTGGTTTHGPLYWPGQIEGVLNGLVEEGSHWPLNISASSAANLVPAHSCTVAPRGIYGAAPRTFGVRILGETPPKVPGDAAKPSSGGTFQTSGGTQSISNVTELWSGIAQAADPGDVVPKLASAPIDLTVEPELALASPRPPKTPIVVASNAVLTPRRDMGASTDNVGAFTAADWVTDDAATVDADHPTVGGSGIHLSIGSSDVESQKAPGGPLFAKVVEAATAMMREIMVKNSIRIGQFAMQRNGKLVLALACTWAEEGYPAARHGHLLRVGSVSKALTGLAAIAHFDDATIAEPVWNATRLSIPGGQANVHSINAELLDIRIEELMRHRTGWGGTEADPATFDAETVSEEQVYDRGAYSRFIVETQKPLFRHTDDGAKFKNRIYNNANFSVLSEIVGHKVGGEFNNYELALSGWWNPILGIKNKLPHLIIQGFGPSLAAGDAPCHMRLPGWLSVDNELIGWQYAERGVDGGAGAWVMSAIQLARIGSKLDPLAPAPHLEKTPDVSRFMAPYTVPDDPAIVEENDARVFGWDTLELKLRTLVFGVPKMWPAMALSHNGMEVGGSSFFAHVFDPLLTSSITVALIFNQDVFTNLSTLGPLMQPVQDVEDQDAWPEQDLSCLAGLP